MRAAAAPDPVRSPSPLPAGLRHSHWCLRWLGSFCLLLVPVRPPPALCCPQGSLRRFRSPGAILPLQACQCPSETRLPLSISGDPPQVILPIQRPCAPPLYLPLSMICWPRYPTGRRPPTFLCFLPREGPPFWLRPRPRRWTRRCCRPRPLLPLVCPPPRFSPVSLFLPEASSQHPLPPLRSGPPSLTLTPRSSFCSIQRFWRRYPLRLPLSCGNSPPATSICTSAGGSSVALRLPLASFAVIAFPSVFPVSSPTMPPFDTLMSLVIPHAPPPPPQLSRGLLCPPAPPPAPPPPAQAVNIAHEEKYFGARTGGGEICWENASGSAPRRKCPSRPLAVVGNGMKLPLFLHCRQQ